MSYGYGIYICNNGTTYEGYWKDDKRHGYGVYINTEDDNKYGGPYKYEGQWNYHKRQGHGVETIIYGSGSKDESGEPVVLCDKYEGIWDEGYKNGVFKVYNSEDITLEYKYYIINPFTFINDDPYSTRARLKGSIIDKEKLMNLIKK